MKRQSPNPAGTPPRSAGLEELTRDLTERVKELHCLYSLSRLFEDARLSIDDILQGVIDSVPPAWQYPEITGACIKSKDREFSTPNFRDTAWKQVQNITVNGKPYGAITVCYLEARPPAAEGPFLKEERNLLYVIAERLGHAIEREMAENNIRFLYQRERELREKLQSEMKVRVEFTRKLIHELKTPLTALIATSQLLSDEAADQRLGKLARYIQDGASNLNLRIEELNDVVRGEIGVLRLNPQPVQLENLIRGVVEETRALCQQSGMSIELHIDTGLPRVNADPDRIRQVILNLINNAAKYAREGRQITIRATRQPGYLQVEVQDYGPGIPEKRQGTIFEPGYQQAHPEEITGGGLGIGLTLCKTLVELHGGRIWVKSKTGRGACFSFTIPIKETESLPPQ